MQYLRAALPIALILVLAACGGTGPTPTPPSEQPPTETPPIVQPPVEQPPEESGPVINSFTATPSTVRAGEPVMLSWDVSNAAALRLDPDPGQGDLSGVTGVTVYPTVTTTYTLEAVSLDGFDDTASLTVTVEGSTQPPPTDNEYAGDWIWIAIFPDDSSLSGFLSITEAATIFGNFEGGQGGYLQCDGDDCESNLANPVRRGTAGIGISTLEDGTENLAALFESNNGYLEIIGIDDDGQLGSELEDAEATFLGTGGYFTGPEIDDRLQITLAIGKVSSTPMLPLTIASLGLTQEDIDAARANAKAVDWESLREQFNQK